MFHSESNLREHLRSKAHTPENVPCAFKRWPLECTLTFVGTSAMILHFEAGTSGATLTMINEWTYQQDDNSVITLWECPPDGPDYVGVVVEWGSAYDCDLFHKLFWTLGTP
ncbi:hypothetical protein JVU11DRAFT_4669 [Chiua virens]|nr:hypothetical protein JVU11DRAFT_4669 [Chiua virens]